MSSIPHPSIPESSEKPPVEPSAVSPSGPADAPALPQPRKFRYRRRLLFCGWVAVAAIALYFFNPLPGLLTRLLVYETPLEPADVVLVGSTGGVLEAAAQLVKEGYAKYVLITQGQPERYRGLDAPITLHYFIEHDLKAAGIPEDRIFSLEKEPTSMLETQQLLRRWIREHQIRSYICLPGLYNSRFQKILHDSIFPRGDVKLIVITSDGKSLMRKQVLSIQNTLIRMGFWRWVYQPKLKAEAM